MQARCLELEEQQARLESQIGSAEQRCAATLRTGDGLQQDNVHLRQQLDSGQATISSQVSVSRMCASTNMRTGHCLFLMLISVLEATF